MLFSLGLLIATRELLQLTLKLHDWLVWILAAIFAVIFYFTAPLNPQIVFLQSAIATGVWILIAGGLMLYRHHGNWPLLARVILLGLGLDLVWICGHALVYLHSSFSGIALIFVLTIICFADIGAYFVGRRFGRHKLAPAVSPGKTWEGVFGGLGANLLWIVIVFLLAEDLIAGPLGLTLSWFLAIGLATSAISVVGDLFESVIKREAGVKDSGTLLPGHGGVLDRIDGVIAAAPVFVTGLFLVNQI